MSYILDGYMDKVTLISINNFHNLNIEKEVHY